MCPDSRIRYAGASAFSRRQVRLTDVFGKLAYAEFAALDHVQDCLPPKPQAISDDVDRREIATIKGLLQTFHLDGIVVQQGAAATVAPDALVSAPGGRLVVIRMSSADRASEINHARGSR
jgi:hypothetical protein